MAVLIITCPCALGLAVPAVQVIASGRLMRRGVLLKSATALERLAGVDTVVLDKTGTLTEGRPVLVDAGAVPPDALAQAAASPAPAAIRSPARSAGPPPGCRSPKGCARCRAAASRSPRRRARSASAGAAGRWRTRRGRRTGGPRAGALAGPAGPAPVRLGFTDPLRADAAQVVAALRDRGLAVELLSGDREPGGRGRRAARHRGLARRGVAGGEGRPPEALLARGRRVLMVGDGLNDAPALAAATVSLSPATAVDISQTAADAVFQGGRLAPMLEALDVAPAPSAW